MTLVQQTAYIPKRLRRFNDGRGRLRPGRQIDLPKANQQAIGEQVSYPALDYQPEDLVTDLGVATVTAAAGSGAVAGIATAVQGAQNAMFRISGLEYDDDSSGNILSVLSATVGFALELNADGELEVWIDDGTLAWQFRTAGLLPASAAGEGEIWLVIDLNLGEQSVAILHRRASADPLQLLEYFPTPGLTQWADSTINCSFLALAATSLGDGAAPAGGLGATADLSFWANSNITGW